jgi:hypothetical protein
MAFPVVAPGWYATYRWGFHPVVRLALVSMGRYYWIKR